MHVTSNMFLSLCVCITSYLITRGGCSLQGKIVGGQLPNITDFPHSAFLSIQCQMKRDSQIGAWICGSSILNQQLLLTAAHCVAECSPNSWISVSVGHVHVKKGWRASGSSYLVHEDYYPDTTINDIGLVRLKTALQFNSNVNRVIILKNPPYNELAQVAGWGVTDAKRNKVQSHLKFIEQHVWNTKDCIDLLNSIPRGTICASSTKEGDYASGGDSGSALIVRGYIQIGIVSYKKPDTSQSVVVYTDVGFFYKWIRKNAKLLFCEGY